MSDESLIKESAKPPDFSTWTPTQILSIFIRPEKNNEMYYPKPEASDIRMPLWAGKVEAFEKDSLGVGWNYRLFDQEPRFKCWGMKDEKPTFSYFSVLRSDGKWEVFSIASYRVSFKVEFGTAAESKKVVAVRMLFFRRDKDTLLSDLTFVAKR